ncbi:hypothetical protein, partial [Klebsiella phage vB_Kpn_3]
MVLKFG